MTRDEEKHQFWKRAAMFAQKKHEGQLDDDGKDYFTAHSDALIDLDYMCLALFHA